MRFLSGIKDLCIDFLFPKAPEILELESLSALEIIDTLPPAEDVGKDILALFDYSHPLTKELIWELKYKGNKVVARKLGDILYDYLLEELGERSLFEKWDRLVLVPIPISDKRRFERGWNQSELLAQEVMRKEPAKLFKYLPRQLVKVRHTESQTKTTSKSERLKNLEDSMKVLHAPQVSERCVVVVDDVTTTGATFREAKRALETCGAKKIICIAVAH